MSVVGERSGQELITSFLDFEKLLIQLNRTSSKNALNLSGNGSACSIKTSQVASKKSDGGLDMKDFVLFDKASKLTWVKRMWNYIPKSSLSGVGGTELCLCNYDYSLLDLNGHLPEFYKQTIHCWQEIVSTTPNSKTEIPSIWNNKFSNLLRLTKKWCICLIGTEQD